MKKLLFLLSLPLAALAQPMKGYVVSGKLTGLKDTTKVMLYNGANGMLVNTATAKDGVFSFKGTLTEPSVFIVALPTYSKTIDFFMQNDSVSIAGDINAVENMEVKGSVLQNDFKEFIAKCGPFLNEMRALAPVINAERDAARRDSLISIYNSVKAKGREATIAFIKSKPASPVSSFALGGMAPVFDGIADIEEYYKTLQPAAKKGGFNAQLEKAIADDKIGRIGTQALDFTQNDVNGKPVSLSSFKGKYVLVDFWASWCKPCRMENPNVVNAYNTFKDKKFTVLGVSLDQTKSAWLDAIKADGLTWTHVSDLQYWNNAAAQLYRVQSIPANLLIDPSGKIVGKDLRGEELHKVLKELLD